MHKDPRYAAAEESLFEYFMPIDSIVARKTCTFTPLHLALLRSYNDVAARLLTSGGEVDTVIDRAAAIHWAVGTENREILVNLLARKAKANPPHSSGIDPLQIVLACGRVDLTLPLEHCVSPDEGTGEPAIYLTASFKEHDQAYKAVHELLARGADPNGREKYWALEMGLTIKNLGVMELLLSHGADPYLDPSNMAHVDSSTMTQLLLRRQLGHNRMHGAYFTYEGEQFLTSFRVARGAGHEARVRRLLQSGLDDQSFQYLWSPLLIAISFGRRNVFDLLLDHTADIDSAHAGQGTALQHAIRKGYKYFVVSLSERARMGTKLEANTLKIPLLD
jgi:ankyrin repeat protein